MGICSFLGAKDIAALMRSLTSRLLNPSGVEHTSDPEQLGWLLGWFEVLLFAILEVNRVTDSRVTDALRAHYQEARPGECNSIMATRDLASAELYHSVAHRLPLNEDDREMVHGGRAPRAAMELAEAACRKLQEFGCSTDLFHVRKILLEFLRSSVWQELIA